MHRKSLSVFILILLILLICLPAPACASIRTGAFVTAQPTLNLVRVTTVTPDVAQIGAVSIASTSSGATVSIDGTVMGATPYSIRTLSPGTHSLVLQLYGYLDYTGSFVIVPNDLNQQSITLIPVPVTTAPPQVVAYVTTPEQVATVITPETTIPATIPTTAAPVITINPRPTIKQPVVIGTTSPVYVPQIQAATLEEQLKALGPVRIEPVVVQVGTHKKEYMFDTFFPYFSYQFNTRDVNSSLGYHTPTVPTYPMSYLEVDKYNVYLKGSHLMSSVEVANDPVWADRDVVFIKPTDTFYNNTNFRWISFDKDATAFYQVSRNPFSDNVSE